MSILGTPPGMTFTDWLVNSTGKSILNINKGNDDWINEKWNNDLYLENEDLKKQIAEEPDYKFYAVIISIVFVIGVILGK